MARIPLPERGIPLDVTYLYQIANAVNDLATQISSAVYNYTTIKTPEASNQSIKTSEARIVAGYVDNVINNENILAGSTRAFSYEYPSDFRYTPVAIAVPVNNGQTTVGNDVSVVLTSVTTSRVDGVIRAATTGVMSVGVNVFIIGIPT